VQTAKCEMLIYPRSSRLRPATRLRGSWSSPWGHRLILGSRDNDAQL
jgi:hypothetical protein